MDVCHVCARAHPTRMARLTAHHAGLLADLAALDSREPVDRRQARLLATMAAAYAELIAAEGNRPPQAPRGPRTLPTGIYADDKRPDRYRAMIWRRGKGITVGRWFASVEEAVRARDAALTQLEDSA